MKALGVILLVLAGMGALLAIGVVEETPAPGIATYVGAFAIPALLGWWGWIAFNWKSGDKPNPDTHVRCPECRELVLREASLCKHCGTRLRPQ